MNNQEIFELVKTGSPLASALALTLLNHRTSGQILMAVSELNTGGKLYVD